MSGADDLDDLLDSLEKDLNLKKNKITNDEALSDISREVKDLLDFDVDNDAKRVEESNTKENDIKRSETKKKCFPVLLTGADGGLGSAGQPR